MALSSNMATVVGMSRRATSAAILVAASPLRSGCGPLLPSDPRFATNSGARPQGVATAKPPPPGPPSIAAPKNDLSWRDCTKQVLADAGVSAPPGLLLECATYDADLDPANGASGT